MVSPNHVRLEFTKNIYLLERPGGRLLMDGGVYHGLYTSNCMGAVTYRLVIPAAFWISTDVYPVGPNNQSIRQR
jgi:hypothetical protein